MTYADFQQNEARELLKHLIETRCEDSEKMEALADYVNGGWEMLADDGWVPSRLTSWVEVL